MIFTIYIVNLKFKFLITLNFFIKYYQKSQYLYYSIFSSIISLLGIFSTIWLSIKTTSSVQNSKAISLITLGQNIIWDAYGCITNFFIMAGDDVKFYWILWKIKSYFALLNLLLSLIDKIFRLTFCISLFLPFYISLNFQSLNWGFFTIYGETKTLRI